MISLNFSKSEQGLLPAIAQDYVTGDILMLAYINQEAWKKHSLPLKPITGAVREIKFGSKGETSGHVQLVKDILVDCDEDTVVFKVEQLGEAACHKGYGSCFFRRVDGQELTVVGERVFDPDTVYNK